MTVHNKIEVVPSILTDVPDLACEYMKQANGISRRIHVDIIDGVFADNKTILPEALLEVDTKLLVDFHLMVNEPVNWIEKCIRAGADRIIGQVEMMTDQFEFISRVQEVGASPGLAVDIDTPISAIEKNLLGDLDLVLVMSVPAGFGGQKFHTEALDKLKLLAIMRKNEIDYVLADDGGITFEYMDDLAEIKVDEAVIGSRIFEGDLGKNIHAYEKSAK